MINSRLYYTTELCYLHYKNNIHEWYNTLKHLAAYRDIRLKPPATQLNSHPIP